MYAPSTIVLKFANLHAYIDVNKFGNIFQWCEWIFQTLYPMNTTKGSSSALKNPQITIEWFCISGGESVLEKVDWTQN